MVYGILVRPKEDLGKHYGNTAFTDNMIHSPSKSLGYDVLEPQQEIIEQTPSEANLKTLTKMVQKYKMENKVSGIIPIDAGLVLIVPLSSIYSTEIAEKLMEDEFYKHHFEPPVFEEQLPQIVPDTKTTIIPDNNKTLSSEIEVGELRNENTSSIGPINPELTEALYGNLNASRVTE